MWAKVLSILERSNNIGPNLALYYPRYRETPIKVLVPDDFARLAPKGSYTKRYSLRLLYRHSCPNICHSISLHNAVYCLKRCPRTKKGCEHECPRPCRDLYEPKCQVVLFNIPLLYRHIARQLRYHKAQILEEICYQVQIEQVIEHYKHKIRVHYHKLPLNANHPYSAICGAALTCRHNYIHAYKDCNTRIKGIIIKKIHRVYNT